VNKKTFLSNPALKSPTEPLRKTPQSRTQKRFRDLSLIQRISLLRLRTARERMALKGGKTKKKLGGREPARAGTETGGRGAFSYHKWSGVWKRRRRKGDGNSMKETSGSQGAWGRETVIETIFVSSPGGVEGIPEKKQKSS